MKIDKQTAYPSLCDIRKVVLRGKFRGLSAYIEKRKKGGGGERLHAINLIAHLKTLGKKVEITPERNRWEKNPTEC